MKMKQISDTTLKITMSLEDLMDRGMEIADFLVPQEKTEEFFYAILDELEMPESFLDTGMLSFRVTPKPDKVDVFVTKSKIDQNLDFEDLSDLPDMEELAQMSPDEFIKTLEKSIADKTKDDLTILVDIENHPSPYPAWLLARMREFADDSDISRSVLQEYGQVLMNHDAVLNLQKIG